MTKTRNQNLDIARGIAMAGVLVVHMQFVGLYPFGAAVSIPLFFLITGYLAKPADNITEYAKKRAIQLMVPYLATSMVIIVIAVIRGLIRDGAMGGMVAFGQWVYAAVYGAGDEYTTPFYIPEIGAIWFLWGNLWGVLILQLALRLKNKAEQALLIIAFFIAGWASAQAIWLPFSIQAGFCAAGFMYIGYLAKDLYPYYAKATTAQKGIFLTGCLIAFGLFYYFFEGFWLVHCEFAHGPLDMIGSLAACVLVMAVSGVIAKYGKVSKRFLSAVGRYSLVVLCVHIIELDIFPWQTVNTLLVAAGFSEYLAWNVMIRLLKLIWIAAATWICVKLPVTRKIFSVKD